MSCPVNGTARKDVSPLISLAYECDTKFPSILDDICILVVWCTSHVDSQVILDILCTLVLPSQGDNDTRRAFHNIPAFDDNHLDKLLSIEANISYFHQ